MTNEQHVFLVDDEPSVRKAIAFSIRSLGLSVKCFPSADRFLGEYRRSDRGCVVLDVNMPGMNGLDLQKKLIDGGVDIPIIFLTGHGDVSTSVEAMRRGAVDFIEKPCDEDRLLESIHRALEKDRQLQGLEEKREAYARYYTLLTEREKEVMEFLVRGWETKPIANRLQIAPRTVDNHRAAVLEKMRVDNVASLTRFVVTVRTGAVQP